MKRKIVVLLFPVLVYTLSLALVEGNASDGEKTFKLLTLNLLFSQPTEPRFTAIADFIARNDIDCILCQEVVGGQLAKKLGLTQSMNSSLDLERDLETVLGTGYKFSYRLADGLPLLFSVGNAIFCKKSIDIKWTVSKTLSFATEITLNGVDIKLRRLIMGSLLESPGFGKLLLFNVHLCSFCPTDQRQVQIDEALEFISTVKNWVHWIYGGVPCVFAGDFNISDNGTSTDSEEYNSIIDAGFTDAYAEENGCVFGYCCAPVDNPLVVEQGCTFAVDDNPFESDPDQTTRIDYFFLQGVDLISAKVVFTGPNLDGDKEPFVSDHSGVLVELPYPIH
jgi:endonuclease/exonuclease/phosphatase family metal-dependent hydrolase